MTTPPAGSPPPPPPPAQSAFSTHIAAVTAVLVAVGAVGAATSGMLQPVVDWLKASDQTTSQISAIDERLKLVETNEIERLKSAVKDRDEASRMAREIEKRIEEEQRSGSDVDDLQLRLREVELRMERLSAQIEFLKDRRR